MPYTIIEPYNLLITFLITVAYQCLGFFIAWTFQFDKITDFTGGSNFFILALITLTTTSFYYARQVVASVLMMIWAARLGLFLLYRVLKRGSDSRFDEMRSHFFKFAGFWVFQIIWVWTVSLPVVLLNSPIVGDPARGGANPKFGQATDILGVILFAIGFIWETAADFSKLFWKDKNPPKGLPCDVNVWRFSRHPPYFGEITLHLGLWLLCLAPTGTNSISKNAEAAQSLAVVSPLLTAILLLFLSGIPTSQKPAAKKAFLIAYPPDKQPSGTLSPGRLVADNDTWAKYKQHLETTSVLFPVPPSIYRRLPKFIKRTILLDWGMYRFTEEDGAQAVEEERNKKSNNA